MHYNERTNAIKVFLKALLHCLPALFWCLLLFSFDTPYIAVISIVCAVIHECGHELYICRKSGKLRMPRGAVNGLKISYDELSRLSYSEEAMLYAAGPLANILSAMLFPIYSSTGEYGACFAIINLTTAISNLIPIKCYDGYGILNAFLKKTLPCHLSQRITETLSFGFTLVLCITSLYFIDRFGESYWIFFVFLASLLSGIAGSLKNNNCEKK